MIKRITTIIFYLFFGAACFGQVYSSKDFTEVAPFKYESAIWRQLNWSPIFDVFVKDGKLQIINHKITQVVSCTAPDGEFIAVNGGEWGGGLYYKTNDTTKRIIFVNEFIRFLTYEPVIAEMPDPRKYPNFTLVKGKHTHIEYGNTFSVIPYLDGWLFIQGDQSSLINTGSLGMIKAKADTFAVTRNFIFKHYPYAITVAKGNIYVATYNGFYCLDKHFEQKFFLDNLFWKNLSVVSIAVKNKRNIYLGMSGGYAKINMPAKSIKFYMYNKLHQE